jgi:hypothetical protein
LDIGGVAHTYSVSGRKLQLSVSGTYLLNSYADTTVFSVTRLNYDADLPVPGFPCLWKAKIFPVPAVPKSAVIKPVSLDETRTDTVVLLVL